MVSPDSTRVSPEGLDVLSWRWDFGDGTVLEGDEANPVHVYSTAGRYAVILTVTTAQGSPTVTKDDAVIVSEGLPLGLAGVAVLACAIVCVLWRRAPGANASAD